MQLRYLGHGNELVPMELIDQIQSLVWTERYQKPGDFELVLDVTNEINERVMLDVVDSLSAYGELGGQDCYFDIYEDWRTFPSGFGNTEKFKTVMIGETFEMIDDLESGAKIKITGRTLGSLLDRRIVWGQQVFDNQQILSVISGVLNPAITEDRSFDILSKEIFVSQSPETKVILFDQTNKLTAQWTGDPIDEVIQSFCKVYNLGYDILWEGNRKTPMNSEEPGSCHIVFYSGADRSNRQSRNSPVIFSTQLDNLLSDDYLQSLREYKNVALVAGEDEGTNRKTVTVYKNTTLPQYLRANRRELFVDARDIQKEKPDGTEYSDFELYNLLQQRGLEKMADYPIITAMEAGINTMDPKFVYGRDYFIGDKVTIITNFGLEISAVVTEVVRSLDTDGLSINPTFELIQ